MNETKWVWSLEQLQGEDLVDIFCKQKSTSGVTKMVDVLTRLGLVRRM